MRLKTVNREYRTKETYMWGTGATTVHEKPIRLVRSNLEWDRTGSGGVQRWQDLWTNPEVRQENLAATTLVFCVSPQFHIHTASETLNAEGNKLLERQKRSDNIKMCIKETTCNDTDWIHLTLERFTAKNMQVSDKKKNLLTSWVNVSFSIKILLQWIQLIRSEIICS
jgi:hypothetical protein